MWDVAFRRFSIAPHTSDAGGSGDMEEPLSPSRPRTAGVQPQLFERRYKNLQAEAAVFVLRLVLKESGI